MEQVVVQVWPRATNRSQAHSCPVWVSTHFPSPKSEEGKPTRRGGNLEGKHHPVQFLEVTESVTQFGNLHRNKSQNLKNRRGLSGCAASTDEPVIPHSLCKHACKLLLCLSIPMWSHPLTYRSPSEGSELCKLSFPCHR